MTLEEIQALQARVTRLEAEVKILFSALQLSLVAAKPTSDWLDRRWAGLDVPVPKEEP